MRELMLELLTYEPFEKINGDEKKYIDAVLDGNTTISKKYPLYDELMDAYKKYYDAGDFDDTSSLVVWFKKYYIITQKGNIDVLSYRSNGVRAYYPVLFKKICICGLLYSQLAHNTRDGHANADFFEKFGMRENILNKWHVSTRYLFLANRDTYSSFRIDRSGLKKPYLTRVIKKVYYESANQLREFIDTAKKYELETFVDVFSATGTVAASVDAKNVVVNDIDAGASCFLFAFVNYKGEVKKRIAKFHEEFVSGKINEELDLYSEDDLERHYLNYSSGQASLPKQLDIQRLYDKEFYDVPRRGYNDEDIILGHENVAIHREFIKNVRNNYLAMEIALNNWNNKYQGFDLSNLPTNDCKNPDVSDVIDYGAIWFCFWSIRKSNAGKEPFKTDISERSYADYLENVLGFAFRNTANYADYSKSSIDKPYDSKYFVLRMKHLLAKNITFNFDGTHDFFKYMKNAKVYNKSYEVLINELQTKDGRYFYYLDSPYFLTTDYKIPFRDKEHEEMLRILREADFHWLFSMQYYKGSTKKVKSVARRSIREYSPQIKDYDTYYKGFINEFELDKSGYWVVEGELDDEKLNKLFVILFKHKEGNREFKTNEIMICNFDIRPAIKYAEDAVILPMSLFLQFEKKGLKYGDIYSEAIIWRQSEIESAYYTGAWV